jgi:predicted RNA-binding Zn ribbon-like protein
MNATETPNPYAAPNELEALRQFVNTRNIEAGTDDLAAVETASSFLRSLGLIKPLDHIGDTDLDLLVELREAFRACGHANAGHEDEVAARRQLDAVAKRIPLRISFVDSPQLVGTGTVGERAAAALCSLAYNAMQTGIWSRLKACKADACQWMHWDSSRNRSAVWCSMSVCGNRTKARAYRTRHAAASSKGRT